MFQKKSLDLTSYNLLGHLFCLVRQKKSLGQLGGKWASPPPPHTHTYSSWTVLEKKKAKIKTSTFIGTSCSSMHEEKQGGAEDRKGENFGLL